MKIKNAIARGDRPFRERRMREQIGCEDRLGPHARRLTYARREGARIPFPCRRRLWGAGRKNSPELVSMGFRTFGDISSVPMQRRKKLLGKWGEHLCCSQRTDDRPVCG